MYKVNQIPHHQLHHLVLQYNQKVMLNILPHHQQPRNKYFLVQVFLIHRQILELFLVPIVILDF